MSKKAKTEKKLQPSKVKNVKRFNVVNTLLLISLVLNFVLGFLIFSSYGSTKNDLYFAIGKGAFTASGFVTLRDDEDTSFSVRIAQLFDNKTLRTYGHVAVFDVRNFPSCSLIVDTDAKVVSLGLLRPLYLSGAEQDVDIFFSKFSGLGIQALVGNEGIFKPDDASLELFADRFKDGFIKAMKLLFIKIKGKGEFDSLFPNGISLASVGDRLRTFVATDVAGNNLNLSILRGKKSAIIYVDPGCGSCKAKCGTLRDILKPLGVNVIFISQGGKEDVESFKKDYLKEETLIVDEDNKVANTLYLGEPAYLMLIDKDLTIEFKRHINDIALDAEPAINKFVK